jgi:hypothetical protein
LIYCASMMKYKRRYSARLRMSASRDPQDFYSLLEEQTG